MKYLVLGSRGQIGSSLCDYLVSQGHQVLEIDIELGSEHDLRLTNNRLLDQALQECDVCLHLAWDVGGSHYLARYQDSYDFIANNLQILTNTMAAIKNHGTPVIFASSQMASMSHSSYGQTKSLAERMVRALGGITVKFWNVYGVEHDAEKTHVITDFVIKARDTGIINMRTDGRELRQMLHAQDCSRALCMIGERYHDLPRHKSYDITSFEWSSVLDIADIVADFFPGTVILPGAAGDTVQQDARNEPDPFVLEFWRPEITLRDGIAAVIMQMFDNQRNIS